MNRLLRASQLCVAQTRYGMTGVTAVGPNMKTNWRSKFRRRHVSKDGRN